MQFLSTGCQGLCARDEPYFLFLQINSRFDSKLKPKNGYFLKSYSVSVLKSRPYTLILLREAIIRDFFFYEVPIYFFSSTFRAKKIDDFEGCLKGVDVRFKGVAGCLKCV